MESIALVLEHEREGLGGAGKFRKLSLWKEIPRSMSRIPKRRMNDQEHMAC